MTQNNELKEKQKEITNHKVRHPSYDEHCLRNDLISGHLTPERAEEVQAYLDWLNEPLDDYEY